MTISFVGAGTASGGSTSVAPTYPAGEASDLLLALVSNKGYAVVPSASGWLSAISTISSEAPSVASDGGVRGTVFLREAPPTSSGSVTFDLTGANTAVGNCYRFATTLTSWNLKTYAAVDITNWGLTFDASTTVGSGDFTTGDWIVVAVSLADNSGHTTPRTLTVAGCTLGAITYVAFESTATGDDSGQYIAYAQIASGSSTGSVTYSASATLSDAAVSGVMTVLRLREQSFATTDVRPGSTVSSTGWTVTGAASAHAAVNESVPSDAEYVQGVGV